MRDGRGWTCSFSIHLGTSITVGLLSKVTGFRPRRRRYLRVFPQSLVHRLHFGAEIVDVESEGFTDDGGNGVVGIYQCDQLLRTRRRRRWWTC